MRFLGGQASHVARLTEMVSVCPTNKKPAPNALFLALLLHVCLLWLFTSEIIVELFSVGIGKLDAECRRNIGQQIRFFAYRQEAIC